MYWDKFHEISSNHWTSLAWTGWTDWTGFRHENLMVDSSSICWHCSISRVRIELCGGCVSNFPRLRPGISIGWKENISSLLFSRNTVHFALNFLKTGLVFVTSILLKILRCRSLKITGIFDNLIEHKFSLEAFQIVLVIEQTSPILRHPWFAKAARFFVC